MRRVYGNVAIGHQQIYWILKANLNEPNQLEDADANGRIILKLSYRNRTVGRGLDSSGSRQGQVETFMKTVLKSRVP